MRDPLHKGTVLWTMVVLLLAAVLAVPSTYASGNETEDTLDIQRESTQGDLDRDSIHFDGVRHEEIQEDHDEGLHEMEGDREDLRNDLEEREQIEDHTPPNQDMPHESLHELENQTEEEKH